MKTKFIAALIALTFTASGSAFAQRGDHGYDRDHDRNGYSQQQHHDRRDDDRRLGRQDQQQARRDQRAERPLELACDARTGQRAGVILFAAQKIGRHDRYVVNNWRGRHLSAPPRGYHWVQTGNDYVLAAIATGIIAQVLFAN